MSADIDNEMKYIPIENMLQLFKGGTKKEEPGDMDHIRRKKNLDYLSEIIDNVAYIDGFPKP